ncbi:tape measure protein [Dysgonomonas sp. 25]|uniref:tape measure protein n=1 Tax=Dysgonomonas sp. 25 TaxID=2302933 RepID=UPI0013D3C753|nr:tape measure protein [Dysgonomonas sp. 25]NDV68593.1 hypothetical protein [Dysgonomonas sp. 25]
MANIGNLSFGIGGDDKELRKILEARKKDAVELQNILSSLNLKGKNSMTSQLTDAVRKKEQLNRLEQSNLRLQQTQDKANANSIINQEKVNQAKEKTRKLNIGNLRLDNERVASEERAKAAAERTEAVRKKSAAELARIEQARRNEERLNNQRLLTEVQRTEAARRRAALIGVQGENDLNRAALLANKTFFSQKVLLSQIATQLGVYFSVYQLGAFVKELAMVSGEFEKQRLSLASILQNKLAADKLFGQIKDLAVYSPFNFKELTDYAKQLSAFSFPTDELFETMTRLADISAGLGVDMGRIILAVGQVRAASVLRGQELRQFTEAGIPLVDELANKFTKLEGRVVSAGEVFDKISNREVPFAMIKEILEDLTNEGGKFFNMQMIQATSLAGMISNLRDAYDIMLDSIGSANSDMLKGAVGGLVEIMDNWERYWNILKMIIIGYGSYKAAIIAATVASQGLVKTIRTLTIVQTIFNSLSKINPYALAFAGLMALIGGLVTFINHQNEAKEKLLETITVMNNHAESVNELIDKLKDLTKANENDNGAEAERAKIINELAKKEPELAKAIKEHADNLEYLTEIQERYNTLMDAKKFAKYAIAETDGFFSNGIVDNLTDMEKAKNKADMLAVSLDTTYTKFTEAWKKIKENGGVDTPLGKAVVKEERINQIDTILASQKTHAEKMLEIYSLVEYAGERAFNSMKKTDIGDANLAKRIIGDDKDKINEYSASLWDLEQITKTTNDDLTTLANTLSTHFKNKGIDVLNPENASMLRDYIKSMEELGTYGQKEILSKWNIEFTVNGKNTDNLDGWRKELRDTLGTAITITTDSNFNDIVKEMKEKYKEVKTRMEEQKPILIKGEYDFKLKAFAKPEEISNSLKQMAEQFDLDSKIKDAIEAAGKLMGLTPADLSPKPKGGSSKKDVYTEELKRQVELIKDAKKRYEDLRKIMSKEDAVKALTSVDEYKHVDEKHLSDEGYVSYLREQLKKIEKRSSDAAKNVRIVWNKEIGAIEIEKLSKTALLEIQRLEKYLSQYKDKYNLYRQISDITGDKKLASSIAFENPDEVVKSYIDELKAAFEAQSGISYSDFLKLEDGDRAKLFINEQVKKLYTSIEEAEKEEKKRKQDIYTSTLKDYLSMESKRLAITQEYEEKISIARSNNNEQLARKLESKLKGELMKLTPEYNKFFTAIYSLTKNEALQIGNLIKANLKEQLDKGVISADEYYNSIKKIDEELKKSSKGINLFMKYQDGGLENVLNAIKEKADSDFASSSQDLQNFTKQYNSALASGDESAANLAQSNMQAAEGSMQAAEGMQAFAGSAMGAVSFVDMIVKAIDQTIRGLQEIIDNIAELAESRGIDTDDGTWGDVKGFMSVLSAVNGKAKAAWDSAKNGDAVGALANTVGIVTSGLSAINQWHDNKLNKAIQKSQFEVKKLGIAYNDILKTIDRQLGAVTRTQSEDMIKNLEKQRDEIKSQLRNEEKKKKTDKNAVEDYKEQIKELEEQIRYFYEDLAGEQFGVKIKDWAKSISDALVDAWSRGEDAAEAFDKTVADIMRSVFKNVLQLQYIEPAMANLRNYLFGSDGRGGILGDGEMSRYDMNGLVNELAKLKGNLNDWQKAWEYLYDAAKQAGIDLEESTSGDTLSKGIQGVTEDTANILASYINAMRADLSMQLSYVGRIMSYFENGNTNFALMQADIMLIQMNTLRTANNTDRLVELSEDTYSILRNASINGSGVKFNIN